MKEISIIGVDLAKNVFQLHGAATDGSVQFRKKLSRPQFQRFMVEHPQCLVVMEACGGAHHWARELVRVGHAVKLIAPHYVKPFIKRQKNDAADAEAIVEAALRPTMRYVEPKTGDQQARSILFRTREQFVKQRTEAVNALRSHLYEFGFTAPEGIGHLPRLGAVLEDPSSDLPPLAREICRELLDQIANLSGRINAMKKEDRRHRQGRRDIPPPADDAGCGSDQRPGRRDLCTANGAVQTGARLCGLAWAGTATGLDRWQAAAWENLENGPTRHPATARHRCDGRDPLGPAPGRARKSLAGTPARTQAADGRCLRAGQQDGAWHLGDAAAR